jgi:signal transduction histidine kinase
MRHSNATRVHVSLARAGGEVTLTVRDDGVGVASQASLVMLEHNGRRGLGGMHDRVAALGGSFDVSMPGSRGLQVSVRLPEGAR